MTGLYLELEEDGETYSAYDGDECLGSGLSLVEAHGALLARRQAKMRKPTR